MTLACAAPIEAIGRELMVGGLVRATGRTRGWTGCRQARACSWLAVSGPSNCLTLLGRRREARALFEKLLGLCNDVGLLAEEYDPTERRQLGNFPQAFSHLALINTALNLENAHGPAHRRGRRGRGIHDAGGAAPR